MIIHFLYVFNDTLIFTMSFKLKKDEPPIPNKKPTFTSITLNFQPVAYLSLK